MHHQTSRVSVIASDLTEDINIGQASAATNSKIEEDKSGRLMRAQEFSRRAAQWLVLIRFRAHAAAPSFSSSMSHYHVLLGAASSDAERLSSCRTMLICVHRQVAAEEMAAQAKFAVDRPADPYGAEWRITGRGAVLHVIADLLSEAIRAFESALAE
ncbi:hypothetical protein E0K89_006865 [Aquicoccus sp. SCR17]|nr:hypothetical protein [Carideicomes alvinocaridis]